MLSAVSDQPEAVKVGMKGLLECFSSLEKEIKAFDVWPKKHADQVEKARLLKSIEGVGDITGSAFLTEIDDPARFKHSRNIAAYLGLTASQYSSRETQKQGRISKQGSTYIRLLLIEAATTMLTRCKYWSPIKAWGMNLMMKKGKKKAIAAVTRKLTVTMHSMLVNKKNFYHEGKEKRRRAFSLKRVCGRGA